ncbi:amidohydrolase family protein [Actinoplanes sp. NPDC051411]|uniref:amidohydrolase family protein n=1 Tax=Actinoplanes sp. NPDC051411 TaxID=3155522 RepID=UPI0034433A9D
MTIDVHGHVTPPELLKRFPMPASLGDVEGMIARKAAAGIDLTIVGSPVGVGTMVPMPGLDNYDQPADRIESFHEWLGETVRAHPGHLRAYAYVNPYAEDDHLTRVAKRLQQEEFVGLIVNTSVRGRYLNAPEAEGVFALAAETGCPILLHPPAEPVGSPALNGHLGMIEHVARPCDITTGVAAILFAGWLTKYPQLKLIAPNAGGALALLREKLDLAWHRTAGPPSGPPSGRPSAGPPSPIAEQLRRVRVDTATPSRLALAAALEVFGPGGLLFGTDSPPQAAPVEQALDLVDSVARDEQERRRIREGNARELFGLTGTEGT